MCSMAVMKAIVSLDTAHPDVRVKDNGIQILQPVKASPCSIEVSLNLTFSPTGSIGSTGCYLTEPVMDGNLWNWCLFLKHVAQKVQWLAWESIGEGPGLNPCQTSV